MRASSCAGQSLFVQGTSHPIPAICSVLIWAIVFLICIIPAKKLQHECKAFLGYSHACFEIHHNDRVIRKVDWQAVRESRRWPYDPITEKGLIQLGAKASTVIYASDEVETKKTSPPYGNHCRIQGCLAGAIPQHPFRWMVAREQIKSPKRRNLWMLAEFPLMLRSTWRSEKTWGLSKDFAVYPDILCERMAHILYRECKLRSHIPVDEVHIPVGYDFYGKPRAFGNVSLFLDGEGRLKSSVGLVAGRLGLILQQFQLPLDSYSILSGIFNCKLNSFLGSASLLLSDHQLCIDFFRGLDGINCSLLGLCVQDSSLLLHLSELTIEHHKGDDSGNKEKRGEDHHPPVGNAKPIHGCLLILVGAVMDIFAMWLIRIRSRSSNSGREWCACIALAVLILCASLFPIVHGTNLILGT
jgi:hypothetical protein